MVRDYDSELRRLARTLAEIAHALESTDNVTERVERALALTRVLVPYRRCALLRAFPDDAKQLFVVPGQSPEEWTRLLDELVASLELLVRGDGAVPTGSTRPQLAVPLVGLNQVIGLLRVEDAPEGADYTIHHIRLLAVVAAQLGAYLTMIRLREEDVRRVQEIAEAHAFQQKLVGMVSHDLRSPLTVISMVASALLQQTDDPQKARAIERALRNARRASRIVSDLLDVTHIRVAGGMSIAPQWMDVAALVNEVVDDMRMVHPGREIEYTPELDASGAMAEVDPERMVQVVTNLLTNALQYGEATGAVRIAVKAPSHADEITLNVHNRGRPIPAERMPGLFDPFQEGSRANRRPGGGLGLGLYIVDQVVRAHGGNVAGHSTVEDGTTFTVTLRRAARKQSTENGRRAEVVLVVDDEFEIRDGIAEMLEVNGYAAITASNGLEALQMLRKGLRPSLILLDLHMPVMDGAMFSGELRADRELASIPLLIVSADAAEAVRLARAQGVRFIKKPLQPSALLDVIKPLAG